jgi:hypothetical protein
LGDPLLVADGRLVSDGGAPSRRPTARHLPPKERCVLAAVIGGVNDVARPPRPTASAPDVASTFSSPRPARATQSRSSAMHWVLDVCIDENRA